MHAHGISAVVTAVSGLAVTIAPALVDRISLEPEVEAIILLSLPAHVAVYRNAALSEPVQTGEAYPVTDGLFTLYGVPDADWESGTDYTYQTAPDMAVYAGSFPPVTPRKHGWCSGGMLGRKDGTLRHVMTDTGSTLLLSHAFYGLSVGDGVIAYPGCAQNRDDCKNKFDNLLNYGGFPWIPDKNPMDGSAVI